jgi:hypothetical protein
MTLMGIVKKFLSLVLQDHSSLHGLVYLHLSLDKRIRGSNFPPCLYRTCFFDDVSSKRLGFSKTCLRILAKEMYSCKRCGCCALRINHPQWRYQDSVDTRASLRSPTGGEAEILLDSNKETTGCC